MQHHDDADHEEEDDDKYYRPSSGPLHEQSNGCLAAEQNLNGHHTASNNGTISSIADSSWSQLSFGFPFNNLDYVGTLTATTQNIEESLERAWHHYVHFAQRNQTKLLLADSLLDRYLWWILPGTVRTTPVEQQQQHHDLYRLAADQFNHHQQRQKSEVASSSTSYHYWRSIIWCLVSLHRLALDLALQQQPDDAYCLDHDYAYQCNQQQPEGDGTTVQLPADKLTYRIRLGLTMIQSLWPLCSHCCSSIDQEVRVRRILERIRFLLRAGLLLRYWKRVRAYWSASSSTFCNNTVLPGLIQMGGLLHVPLGAPTMEHQQVEQERHAYVGRRTGRRVMTPTARQQRRQEQYRNMNGTTRPTTNGHGPLSPSNESRQNNLASSNHPNNSNTTMFRLLLGEVLHIVRPLFWAEAQVACRSGGREDDASPTEQLWKAWLVSLGLDVTSLVALRGIANPNNNQTSSSGAVPSNVYTRQEWKRRQVRLLLYLLRSPVWEKLSNPTLQRSQQILEWIPILGSFLSVYLQDWVYFWKEYRLEDC